MEKPDTHVDKFESQDLPIILAALQKGRDARAPGSVTVHFAENGGVIAVLQEIKRKFK